MYTSSSSGRSLAWQVRPDPACQAGWPLAALGESGPGKAGLACTTLANLKVINYSGWHSIHSNTWLKRGPRHCDNRNPRWPHHTGWPDLHTHTHTHLMWLPINKHMHTLHHTNFTFPKHLLASSLTNCLANCLLIWTVYNWLGWLDIHLVEVYRWWIASGITVGHLGEGLCKGYGLKHVWMGGRKWRKWRRDGRS